MPIAVVAVLIVLIFLPEILDINAIRGLKLTSTPTYEKTEEYNSVADVDLAKEDVFATQVSADKVTSKGMRSLMSNARKRSLKLKKEISTDFAGTHQALDDFIKILEIVISGKFENGVVVAVSNLEKSEMAVTTAMLTDLIQRKDLLAWSKIDLSPVYQSDRVYGIKQYAVSYFDPNLQINQISYKLKSGSHKLTLGGIDSLTVEFILRGDSIKNVEIYRNGKKYKNASVDSSNLSERWDIFEIKINNTGGIYTIALTDVLGKNYYKNYRFNREPPALKFGVDYEKSKKNSSVIVARLQDNFFNNSNILDESYSFQQQFTKQLFEDGAPAGYDEF